MPSPNTIIPATHTSSFPPWLITGGTGLCRCATNLCMQHSLLGRGLSCWLWPPPPLLGIIGIYACLPVLQGKRVATVKHRRSFQQRSSERGSIGAEVGSAHRSMYMWQAVARSLGRRAVAPRGTMNTTRAGQGGGCRAARTHTATGSGRQWRGGTNTW